MACWPIILLMALLQLGVEAAIVMGYMTPSYGRWGFGDGVKPQHCLPCTGLRFAHPWVALLWHLGGRELRGGGRQCPQTGPAGVRVAGTAREAASP